MTQTNKPMFQVTYLAEDFRGHWHECHVYQLTYEEAKKQAAYLRRFGCRTEILEM